MSGESLRVLIAHHRWWFPTSVSGADIANQEFARQLMSRGVNVRVQGIIAPGMKQRLPVREYEAEGVPVCLVTSDFSRRLTATIKEFKPDVVLTSCPEPTCSPDEITRMVDLIRGSGLPVVLFVHDLEGTLPLFEPSRHRLARVVANSHFMAERVTARWGLPCDVVHPVPDWRTVDAGGITGPFITFFNPAPHKGLSIAHSLVSKRLKERPFLFVEGFIDPEAHGIALSRSGNLVHARRSPDVATIYMMTRTLIVPSQWEEPFGRVALEAMYNRIPVIASRTGGLVESVGDGGILIDDFADVDRWVEAVESLDDPATRRRWIKAGRAHAERFSLDHEIDKLIAILRSVAG